MEFTTETWMILGLTLALGWLLGLMSRSGGARWKRELAREREDHAAAIKNRDAQIEALKARTVELERDRPATAYRTDADVRDTRADLRHESSIDNLDLRRREDARMRETELDSRRNPDGTRTIYPR
ncbi:hypothetical protein HJG53_07890 [Sphingomonas sp. ID1715]|uniref:hypothetical protein n=1 Tax=Sphingomonas sp. ID1715 TaxID=1656898 RepID=UPI001489D981|nr:hypothetical protein [Sphingomonas sp. ID1715]NNM76817.1 hypothetical protein [Sphingomonas sp. ID1715]